MFFPGMPVLYWFSRRMTLWGTISFNFAVFINFIIAFFYPYDSGQGMTTAPASCIFNTATVNANFIRIQPNMLLWAEFLHY